MVSWLRPHVRRVIRSFAGGPPITHEHFTGWAIFLVLEYVRQEILLYKLDDFYDKFSTFHGTGSGELALKCVAMSINDVRFDQSFDLVANTFNSRYQEKINDLLKFNRNFFN